MGEYTQVYRDFSRGDWGDMGGYQAGKADGFFKALNMVVYRDGSIGPRVGVKRLAHTGLPLGEITTIGYVASVVGAVTNACMFVVGNNLSYVPANTAGASVAVGTITGGSPSEFVSSLPIQSEDTMFFATHDKGIYRWDYVAGTLTQVSTVTDIEDMTLYRDRLYAAQIRRVYYSDVADFATWGALSYFDVGWSFATYRMAELRNNFHFIRQAGGHYVLSGVPESTSTLRRLAGTLAPDKHSVVTLTNTDQMMWIPQDRSAPVVYNAGISDQESLRHLEDWTATGAGSRGGVYSYGESTVLFVDTESNGLVRRNGVWSRLEFDFTTSVVNLPVGGNIILLTDGGASGVAPNFYRWNHPVDHPGFVGTSALPGDDSDTPLEAWLTLPEWWHPRGWEARVLAVEVEFVSWNTGTTETAHFDLYVDALRPKTVGDASTGPNTSAVQSFDEAVGSSSTSGTERRMRFNVGDAGWSRGFQVRLTNIRNVSIRSVSVLTNDDRRDSR